MAPISVNVLRYSYPRQEVAALRDCSFAIASAQSLSIVGANLAGKTTLANLIMRKHLGQLEGTLSGTIDLHLDESGGGPLGFVFEDVNWMFCNLFVDEEVAFGLESLCVDSGEIRRRVDETLALTGLAGFQRRQINTLSGGEMQKLAIAAVLAPRPTMLITDDLLSNVDVVSAAHLPVLIEAYRRDSDCLWLDLSRRWTDHCSSSDQVALLEWGTLVSKETPLALFERLGPELVWRGEMDVPEAVEMLVLANQMLDEHRAPPIPMTLDRERIVDAVSHRFVRRSEGPRSSPTSEVTEFQVEAVQFRYGRAAPVLNNCSLSLATGRVNVLAGRNGSGKSTLSRICAGLLRPERGRLFWRGAVLSLRALRDKVCMVFQNPEYHFIADSVRDELTLTGGLTPQPEDEKRRRAEHILSVLGLGDKANLSAFALTSGEKRRLAIGIALMRDADILIVDEPTLGQDRKQSGILGHLFRQLAEAGRTILVVSHDSRFIFEYGDVIHLVESGRVSFSGAVPTLFAASSGSDFSRQSDVYSVWERIARDNGSPAWSPHSPRELLDSVEVRAREP